MAKKLSALLGALVLVSAVFVSCGSKAEVKDPVATATPTPQIIGKEGIPMPAWVNTTPKDAETFYAVGYAKKSSKQISITAAEQDARDQIARWIGTSVK